MERKIKVLVWSEGTEPKSVYPNGINGEIASFLRELPNVEVYTSSFNDSEFGLSERTLFGVDVLVWWGHQKHDKVPDEIVSRIVKRVKNDGMGFIPLHSSHFSKPFISLMGTKCKLGSWREDGRPEYVHVFNRKHPIASGIEDFVIEQEEMYGEPFEVPKPDDVVFVSIFEADGAIFRSGLTWKVGKGKVFYFRPGHETYPTYRNENVKRIIKNAVLWVARA
jgi:trehalose utilization protein